METKALQEPSEHMSLDEFKRLEINAQRAQEEDPLEIVLRPGMRIRVRLQDSDGYFDIAFDECEDKLLTVFAEFPGSKPPENKEFPEGIIYCEAFGPEGWPGSDIDPEI